ncbi:hypothetical protein V8C34DRAFT_284212 [Trichoderma compactum]
MAPERKLVCALLFLIANLPCASHKVTCLFFVICKGGVVNGQIFPRSVCATRLGFDVMELICRGRTTYYVLGSGIKTIVWRFYDNVLLFSPFLWWLAI